MGYCRFGGVRGAPLPLSTVRLHCYGWAAFLQKTGKGSVGGGPLRSVGTLFPAWLPPDTGFAVIEKV